MSHKHKKTKSKLVYIKKKEDHFLDERERILYAIRVT